MPPRPLRKYLTEPNKLPAPPKTIRHIKIARDLSAVDPEYLQELRYTLKRTKDEVKKLQKLKRAQQQIKDAADEALAKLKKRGGYYMSYSTGGVVPNTGSWTMIGSVSISSTYLIHSGSY